MARTPNSPLRVAGVASLRVTAVICGVSACAIALLAPGDDTAAAAHRDRSRQTEFVAKRPGLLIKLWVGSREILGSVTYSRLKCEGGSEEPGSINYIEGYRHFPLRPGGYFKKRVYESYEGSGSYFWGLSGRVRPNRIVGAYEAWEERSGEEEFFPRCGTLSPRGLPRHFVAHRVAGPPWRGSGGAPIHRERSLANGAVTTGGTNT